MITANEAREIAEQYDPDVSGILSAIDLQVREVSEQGYKSYNTSAAQYLSLAGIRKVEKLLKQEGYITDLLDGGTLFVRWD